MDKTNKAREAKIQGRGGEREREIRGETKEVIHDEGGGRRGLKRKTSKETNVKARAPEERKQEREENQRE